MLLMRPTRASPLWLRPWAPRRRRVFWSTTSCRYMRSWVGKKWARSAWITRAVHRVKAFPAGRGQAQSGAGNGQVKNFQGKRTHDAVKGGGASGQVGADDPALAVGQRPGREIDGLAGNQVVVVDAVAAGVNERVGGLEAPVDQDAAVGGNQQAGVLGQLGIGGRAHRGDHQVGGQGAAGGDHLQRVLAALDLADFPDLLLEIEVDFLISAGVFAPCGPGPGPGGRAGPGGRVPPGWFPPPRDRSGPRPSRSRWPRRR